MKPTVRQLLNKNTPLLEDFRAKTMAYKRQFRAIFDLKKDEYSAYWRFRQTDGQHDPETEEGRTQSISSDGRQIPP